MARFCLELLLEEEMCTGAMFELGQWIQITRILCVQALGCHLKGLSGVVKFNGDCNSCMFSLRVSLASFYSVM